MKKILIYLFKKKYALMFPEESYLMNLKDLFKLTENEIIMNGVVKDTDKILERWEVNKADIIDIKKTRNSLKLTVEIDCKLLLRKIDTNAKKV